MDTPKLAIEVTDLSKHVDSAWVVNGIDLRVLTDSSRSASFLSGLSGLGIALARFSMDQPSLDEVFLALTGHHTDPAEEALAP